MAAWISTHQPQTSPTPPLKVENNAARPSVSVLNPVTASDTVWRRAESECVSGSNWDELVLIGLYEMFGVISVWALFWRAGSTLGWLGPLPSAAAPPLSPLSFLCLLPLILSVPVCFCLCHRRGNFSLSSHCASFPAPWSKWSFESQSTHPSANNVIPLWSHQSLVKTHREDGVVTCE